MADHQSGYNDSWEIVNEDIARKTCDKSFFEYHGSAVSREIRWFFDVVDLAQGQKKEIVLVYDGVEYPAYLQRSRSGADQIRLFWNSSLQGAFDSFSKDGLKHVLEFQRSDENKFIVRFLNGSIASKEEHQVAFGFDKIVSFLSDYTGQHYTVPEKAGA